MTKFYQKNYPRPQFVRTSWTSLNGSWNFRFDKDHIGIQEHWQDGFTDTSILVPFSYESKRSGIGITEPCDTVWYCKKQAFPQNNDSRDDNRILIHFEGSDYRTTLWVNGIKIGTHEGGYTRFTFDITDALRQTSTDSAFEHVLVCQIEDSFSTMQPRGKQRWLAHNYDCWYTQTTGIWKDVWAEEVSSIHLDHVSVTPLYDEQAVEFEYHIEIPTESNPLVLPSSSKQFAYSSNQLPSSNQLVSLSSLTLETIVSFQDDIIYCGQETVIQPTYKKTISLNHDSIKWKVRYWCPKSPNLYDVQFRLYQDGQMIDCVGSYFGYRKISTDTGRFQLNNMDFYLKMVLDQGYWEDSILTPPDEDALKKDLEKMIEYGYNGVRKHQKIEDERFYYWADVMGIVVWCEMPSFYEFHENAVENVTAEWISIVKQHYNHPSIVAWVPFNESWGVPRILHDTKQQAFTQSIYYLTKSLDSTRPVISNDGWEHTKSDIITLHDYAAMGPALLANWKHPDKNLSCETSFNGERYAFASGFHYEGQPVILSEFGGIAYASQTEGWGYGNTEQSEETFLERLQSLVGAIQQLDFICGYCYTQLTDVQQEQNGHMYMNREDKIHPEKIAKILNE